MKNSTKLIAEKMPFIKKYIEESTKFNELLNNDEVQNLSSEELVFLKLSCYFEDPKNNDFNLDDMYQNLSGEWLILSLKSIYVFFEIDTYLLADTSGFSLVTEDTDYLTQTEFKDFLNSKGFSFDDAKMSVYVQRGKFPEPNLILSDKKYWLKQTCEKYVESLL